MIAIVKTNTNVVFTLTSHTQRPRCCCPDC